MDITYAKEYHINKNPWNLLVQYFILLPITETHLGYRKTILDYLSNKVFSFIISWYKQRHKFVGAVSSVGRASRLHREGHRFESFTAHHFGGVAQLVRAPACHAGGRRFEPGHSRH